jgi:hypothetical protein
MIGKPINPSDIIDPSLEMSKNIETLTNYIRNKVISLRDETNSKKEQKKV